MRHAIEYFERKGLRLTRNLLVAWQNSHAQAFTIAEAMREDILADIYNSQLKALKEGMTEAMFVKDLEPLLRKRGWWGCKTMVDSDGGKVEVQLDSQHWLHNIYFATMRTALAVAHYQSQKANTEARPYWQYEAKDDDNVRPTHAALDGLVFRHDDPFWDTHYPPNDWGCRCRVRAFTPKDVEKRGLKIESSEGKLHEIQKQIISDQSSGEIIHISAFEYRDDDRILIPGAGWNSNPGASRWGLDFHNQLPI